MHDENTTQSTPRHRRARALTGACVALFVAALILVPGYVAHTLFPAAAEQEALYHPTVVKEGLHEDEDGEIRFYVNNKPFYAGLVQDDDGAYYYISGTTLTAVKDITRKISFTNGLLPEGTYTFGPDGKLILESE